ncbi:hypothetical protein NPX13_g11233 [Xylaria arbuscula]|uniref:Uncharacterized protein n=1 Tax=Xylaria arbuscula TaxID=114810 RepID=A0A9W8N324_9PEZI|nr:hypothetical protein NPX13_g11233 [Xylaria arbuscula]
MQSSKRQARQLSAYQLIPRPARASLAVFRHTWGEDKRAIADEYIGIRIPPETMLCAGFERGWEKRDEEVVRSVKARWKETLRNRAAAQHSPIPSSSKFNGEDVRLWFTSARPVAAAVP